MIHLLKILIFVFLVLPSPPSLHAAENTESPAHRLINALGCKGCHRLEGNGGDLAPELDKIGSRLTREQISQHLAAHTTPDKDAFMPSYNTTSQAELTMLGDFLYNLQ